MEKIWAFSKLARTVLEYLPLKPEPQTLNPKPKTPNRIGILGEPPDVWKVASSNFCGLAFASTVQFRV